MRAKLFTHRLNKLLLIVSVLLGACQPRPIGDIPAIPRLELDQYLPIVSRQLKQAEELLINEPLNARNNAHYAMLLHTYEQFEPSVILYQRAIALEQSPKELLYLQAHTLIAVGRITDAVYALQRAHELDPGDPWVLMKLVVTQKLSGSDNTEAQFGDLIALRNEFDELPELHFALGKIYAMEGQLEQAIEHFDKSQELVGPYGAATYAKAIAYRRLGNNVEADRQMAVYQKAQHVTAQGSDPYMVKVEQLNRSDLPLIRLAEKMIKNGQPQRSVKLLLTALERNPSSIAAHISLIGLYSSLNQFESAQKHFDAAKQLAPQRAKLFYNLGLMRLMQQRNVEAEKAFRQAIERDRNDSNAYTQLAVALQLQGLERDSEFYLKRALKIDPANRSARLILAEVSLAKKRAENVIQLLSGNFDPPDGGSPHMILVLVKAHNLLGQSERVLELSEIGIEYAEIWNQKSLINQFKRQIQLANE